ncbi:hypothetical protein K438DRAFT_345504 [Mycena galopus ATCC 62051]|nr:hypothetical protein K438DRAFT_345504 [Mycena galopus ATCC 62051]
MDFFSNLVLGTLSFFFIAMEISGDLLDVRATRPVYRHPELELAKEHGDSDMAEDGGARRTRASGRGDGRDFSRCRCDLFLFRRRRIHLLDCLFDMRGSLLDPRQRARGLNYESGCGKSSGEAASTHSWRHLGALLYLCTETPPCWGTVVDFELRPGWRPVPAPEGIQERRSGREERSSERQLKSDVDNTKYANPERPRDGEHHAGVRRCCAQGPRAMRGEEEEAVAGAVEG